MPKSYVIAQTHYGAGNIGDDLTLSGFFLASDELTAKNSYEFIGGSSFDLGALRKRFPYVVWHSLLHDSDIGKKKEYQGSDGILVIGATPFQLTCGDGVLGFFQKNLEWIKGSAESSMICVGVEAEIEPRSDEFREVASAFSHISTRDEQSRQLLSQFFNQAISQYLGGADLAHISLERITRDFKMIQKEYSLGIIIAGDTLHNNDINAVKLFIAEQREPIAFLANDTRFIQHHECGIYQRALQAKWYQPFKERKAILERPNYESATLEELVVPTSKCETVISSRYHGVLAAAWLGCRVAVINRSSKLTALSAELNLPCCDLPLTSDKLMELSKQAIRLPRKQLMEYQERAIEAVRVGLHLLAPH